MRSRSNNIDLLKDICFKDTVSTHSRLKAAGFPYRDLVFVPFVSTHSRLKAAGHYQTHRAALHLFQHTAARRRLKFIICVCIIVARFNTQPPEGGWLTFADDVFDVKVSTRSRPKAAARFSRPMSSSWSFNTQPPEGGWKP